LHRLHLSSILPPTIRARRFPQPQRIELTCDSCAAGISSRPIGFARSPRSLPGLS
jgi:hypothetical protein